MKGIFRNKYVCIIILTMAFVGFYFCSFRNVHLEDDRSTSMLNLKKDDGAVSTDSYTDSFQTEKDDNVITIVGEKAYIIIGKPETILTDNKVSSIVICDFDRKIVKYYDPSSSRISFTAGSGKYGIYAITEDNKVINISQYVSVIYEVENNSRSSIVLL